MDIGYTTGAKGLRPDLPSLVFVHGAGGRGASWLGLLSPLGRKYNTIGLDLPGHGETPGPPLTDINSLADWLAAALEELVPGRYVLVGHSMGGAVSQIFCLNHPQAAAGLVLIATGAWLPVNPKLLIGLEKKFEATVDKIISWCFATDDPTQTDVSRELMIDAGPEAIIADFTACTGFDVREWLAEITLPSLVISGDRDVMTPPEMAGELAAGLGSADLEMLEGVGHMVQLERMAEVRKFIEAFAGRVLD